MHHRRLILMSAAELAALILCGDEPASGDRSGGQICLHPDDARVNLTVMGGSKKWLCMPAAIVEDGQRERLMVKVERVEFAYVPVEALCLCGESQEDSSKGLEKLQISRELASKPHHR